MGGGGSSSRNNNTTGEVGGGGRELGDDHGWAARLGKNAEEHGAAVLKCHRGLRVV